MTVRAELDQRGRELYGTGSLVLHPEPKPYLLFDEDRKDIDPEGSMRVVKVPSDFDVSSDAPYSDRRFLKVVGDNRVEVERYFYADNDGVSLQSAGRMAYEGLQIDEINVFDARLVLPGLRPDETVFARLKWQRDLPLIGRIRRGWAELKRAARFEDAPLEQG